MQKQVLRTSIH